MRNIKLLEYSQGKQFLEHYKADSIENENKYFCCYDYEFSTFSEVTIGRLLFDYQILVYCDFNGDKIENYIVFRVPLLIEKSTALTVMIANITDSEFVNEVFELVKAKFKNMGWSKITLCCLRYQLTDNMKNFINNTQLKEEIVIHSKKSELDRINYSMVF